MKMSHNTLPMNCYNQSREQKQCNQKTSYKEAENLVLSGAGVAAEARIAGNETQAPSPASVDMEAMEADAAAAAFLSPATNNFPLLLRPRS
jgi:hypothetical protein